MDDLGLPVGARPLFTAAFAALFIPMLNCCSAVAAFFRSSLISLRFACPETEHAQQQAARAQKQQSSKHSPSHSPHAPP